MVEYENPSFRASKYAPNPKEFTYWINLSADKYGNVINTYDPAKNKWIPLNYTVDKDQFTHLNELSTSLGFTWDPKTEDTITIPDISNNNYFNNGTSLLDIIKNADTTLKEEIISAKGSVLSSGIAKMGYDDNSAYVEVTSDNGDIGYFASEDGSIYGIRNQMFASNSTDTVFSNLVQTINGVYYQHNGDGSGATIDSLNEIITKRVLNGEVDKLTKKIEEQAKTITDLSSKLTQLESTVNELKQQNQEL